MVTVTIGDDDGGYQLFGALVLPPTVSSLVGAVTHTTRELEGLRVTGPFEAIVHVTDCGRRQCRYDGLFDALHGQVARTPSCGRCGRCRRFTTSKLCNVDTTKQK